MPQIQVSILDPSRTKKTQVEVPDNVPVQRLVRALVAKMGLPLFDKEEQAINYRLDFSKGGKNFDIDSEATLAQAGVQSGTMLRLLSNTAVRMRPPRVFISYSHDSEAHSLKVLELSNRLRQDGIDAHIDRYVFSPPQGWAQWSIEMVKDADFVIIACTDDYRRRFEEEEDTSGEALWEGSFIRRSLYGEVVAKEQIKPKFIPVLFDDSPDAVPIPLRAFVHYKYPEDYRNLYQELIGQPEVDLPAVKSIDFLSASRVRSKGAFGVKAGLEGGEATMQGLPKRNLLHLLELQKVWLSERLSVIAGAGISAESDLLTWAPLLRELLSAYVRKTYLPEEGIETDSIVSELQQRLEGQSPLIYAQFIRAQFEEKDFEDLVHSALYRSGRRPQPGPICKSIARLAHHLNSIVTFNYDELIEDALESEGFQCTSVYEAHGWSSIRGIPVYHPHGYLPYERSSDRRYPVVLAEADYHTQYYAPHLWSNVAISRVLLECVCLFVGISLTDPNLRRLLDASHREQPKKTHYIIARSPVPPGKPADSLVAQAILEVFAASYQQLGVTPIWFTDYSEVPSLISRIRDLKRADLSW